MLHKYHNLSTITYIENMIFIFNKIVLHGKTNLIIEIKKLCKIP
jgi:hypothetical protein